MAIRGRILVLFSVALAIATIALTDSGSSDAVPSGCPGATIGAAQSNPNSRHHRCSTSTSTPTLVSTPSPTPADTSFPTPTPTGLATPSPTPGFSMTVVTLTNDTTQTANDLHVVVTASNLNPIQQNAPGCEQPTFQYGPGLPAYSFIDITWSAECVEPGESLTLWFSPDCIPCAAPVVTSCSWSLDGDLIGGCAVPAPSPTPSPTPTPTPGSPTPGTSTTTPVPTPSPTLGPTTPFVFTNNSGTTADDLHFFAQGEGMQVGSVDSPSGCGTLGVEVLGFTSIEPIYHVTLRWPDPCVAGGESVTVDLSCSPAGTCNPTLFDGCADWTLSGTIIGTRCPFPPTPTPLPSPTAVPSPTP